MIEINKLSKSYGKIKALIEFDYKFDKGIYALLGPNGSGKSTLMNIITNNLKADSGNINYNGEDILKMGSRFRKKIGFMPQYPGMYPNFSITDFMSYIAVLKDIDKKEAKHQINSLLEAVELSDVKKKSIKSLSGGMKQRLALAQALLGNPEIVILDEPTAGLDPKQRISIRNYISAISIDKTIIIATHIVSDIEFIAKDVIFLKKGIISDRGTPLELAQKSYGIVWKTPVTAAELAYFQEKYKVINIQNTDNELILRILSEEKPSLNSTILSPSLEDHYLHIFGDIL